MLPEIEATELITKLTILGPICCTLANQRQASTTKQALELFRTHIADPAALAVSKAHPSMIAWVPVTMIILKYCSLGCEAYVDLNGDVAYMLNRPSLA